jgi:two-component system sensor histidine kinase CpxA
LGGARTAPVAGHQEGRVIGADRNEMQIIRNFIGQADNADHPQKKNMAALRWSGLSPSGMGR